MDDQLKRDLEEGRGIKPEPLARALGLGRTGIYQACRRGEIPFTRVGRRIIISPQVARRLLGLDEKAA
jgi:excisionase family DNA binding protein